MHWSKFQCHRLLFLLAIRSLHQRPPESDVDKDEVEKRQVIDDGRRVAWKEPGRRVDAAGKVQEGILAKLSLDARLPNIFLQGSMFTARLFTTLSLVSIYDVCQFTKLINT